MDNLEQLGGVMNMKIIIPIVVVVISSLLGCIWYFFLRKKATSPTPAPVQLTVPSTGPSTVPSTVSAPVPASSQLPVPAEIIVSSNASSNGNKDSVFDGVLYQNNMWESINPSYLNGEVSSDTRNGLNR